ncbi:MAG: hypothetical protein AAGU11_13080 [Syntrophobacteraceae bacterium]
MASSEPISRTKEGWVRVFCPYTRNLSAEEIADISPDERRKIEAGDEGVWIEAKCPKDKCLIGEQKISLEARGAKPSEKEGLWHKLFCPEDRCVAKEATDLPS